MTNREAEAERDRIRQADAERAQKERNMSPQERAQEISKRNSERKQRRESAESALLSGSANNQLAEIAKQGGSVGRRLQREIRQFQQTGRVSSWLAGETLKAESAQNAAQQAAFRQQVADVISSPMAPMNLGPNIPYLPQLNKKPEFKQETTAESNCIGLALYVKEGDVWIGAGTVAGQLPSGFDPEKGKSIASGGSGNVWAKVEINGSTGEVNSASVESGSSTPNNTDTSFYYTLGYYEYSNESAKVTNYACGSVDVTVCRNWFAKTSPFYGVSMTRCGCGY